MFDMRLGAMDDNEKERKRGADLFARLSAIQTVVFAIVALFVLAGLMLVGKGFYVKAKDEVAQYLLLRDVEEQDVTGKDSQSGLSEAMPAPLTTGSVTR
ncbi:hypothetical protein [Sinorhizobium medicae]